MSAFINLRTTKKGSRNRKKPIVVMGHGQRKGMWRMRMGWRLRLNIGRCEMRKNKSTAFFGRQEKLFNMAMKTMRSREKARQARLPEECKNGTHFWDGDENCNPVCCTACGMSFIAHIFVECP